jgi:proline iminopeptidase
MKRLLIVLALAFPLAAQEHGTTFALADGTKIYYETTGGGSGAPLIVVNGGPGFDHMYLHVSDVWNTLAKTRAVTMYDQRGNGRSDALKPNQSCTLADQIADLDALRAHLGYDKMDLLGHSWGGYLVMAYTARHPEHVRRLIICDSAAPKWRDTVVLFDQVFPEGSERHASYDFAAQLGDDDAHKKGIGEYLSWLCYSPEKRDAFIAKAHTFTETKAVNQKVNADLARFDLNPEIKKFKMPVLVITGRYDMNVAPQTAWRIHDGIPGSQWAVFERSGHLPWYEEPDAFLAVVTPFLDH